MSHCVRCAGILACVVLWTFGLAAQEAQVKSSDDAGQKVESPVPTTPVKKMPLTTPEARAPRPAQRPKAAPMPESGERTVTEGFLKAPALGAPETAFKAPDWTKPLDDLKADELVMPLTGKGVYEARGNVRLQVEDTLFEMQQFHYDETTGDLQASGEVTIKQPLTVLTADELYYHVPMGDEEVQPIFNVPLTAQEQEKARLTRGSVDARNVHITEWAPDTGALARELRADHFAYDFAAETSELENATGQAGIFYFGAAKVRVLGPANADGEDIWITTCDHDPPHYRIRVKEAQIREGQAVFGKHARLQLGKADTPAYWPRWGAAQDHVGRTAGFDFDSGHRAELGYYLNLGQQFTLSPQAEWGLRLFPTEREGIGLGVDAAYDYVDTPASPLFRGKGELQTLYTTKDRGYAALYHRQELQHDIVALAQVEQWSDRDFYKDFYYDYYRDRTEPRTFLNLTQTKPSYIATATVRKSTNGFVSETERLPEVTYHLLERPIAPNLYASFDTVAGYNERGPADTHAARWVNVGRLTYDWDLHEALNVAPFWETEASWYSDQWRDEDAAGRWSNTAGLTIQSRLHRSFPGAVGFSGFKHVFVPSVTYSYRPESTMDVEHTPRFDAYDNVYGRSRIESKIDNVFYGQDAETKEVWQVARLSLYHGDDFWNEFRRASDYEAELDLRPRPWWGLEVVGERHSSTGDYDLDSPFYFQRSLLEIYERIFDRPYDYEKAYQFNASYGDYDRLLTYLYYDDRSQEGKLNGRIGFAYTETQNRVFNREVLYGLGWRLGDKWGLAFEHRYDFERDDLYQQVYEVRRDLHCWEAALQLRDRESGWDVNLVLNIKGFPGSKVKF